MVKISYSDINREYQLACRNIRHANKGLPAPLIEKDYSLVAGDHGLTLQIRYIDGETKNVQFYNIAL